MKLKIKQNSLLRENRKKSSKIKRIKVKAMGKLGKLTIEKENFANFSRERKGEKRKNGFERNFFSLRPELKL